MSIPVQASLDFGQQSQLLNVIVHVLASDPGSPVEGQVWYNSTTGVLKYRDASTTRTLQLTSVRLDQITAPTAAVGLNSQKITGLADGTVATDAATVGQLTATATGLDFKNSVRVSTTANGTLATAFANGQTVDGITLATGDRILLKNQTAPAENGIYTVNASGAPTRATDFDAWTEIPGAVVAVELGTTGADKVYLSTADQGGTLNTTGITFTSLGPVGPSLTKFAADITGNASATTFTVTHNLGTTDVTVQVYDVTNDLWVITDIKRPTANTARIDFAVAPANLKVYRVVVTG